ncbi:hypothetical protein ABEB36_004771 [Hypothenemus hampei]|uniref:Uncharacterized protein n=1 Tax=Hypothenemus hampei TaxID=57062 RepID=A0ABD1EVT2_HYPHA
MSNAFIKEQSTFRFRRTDSEAMANANSANGAYRHVVNWSHSRKSTQEYQEIGTERKPLPTYAEVSALVNSPHCPKILRRTITMDPTIWKGSQQSLIPLVSLIPGMSEFSPVWECESLTVK